jgi:tetratricopeptide (TPR) repeat protein
MLISTGYTMSKSMAAVLAVAIALCALSIAPAEGVSAVEHGGPKGDTGALVERAREAAAADRHAEAIELFRSACELDSTLCGELGKELGLQYTWNDQAHEALPWFEAYIAVHPTDIEGLLGYARALSWDGRHEESLVLYRSVEEMYPASLEARIGEARVVSWMDRNAEAERLYRSVLESHPESLEARLGLAQVVNWQGRHREARELYREILEESPGNGEALTGLATAERWLGRNDRARAVLGGLLNGGDGGMLAEIEREVSPFVRTDYGVSSDSDELVIHRLEAGVSFYPDDLTSIGFFAGRISMRQDDRPRITIESLSLRLHRRVNEDFAFTCDFSPVITTIFDTSTFDAWLTWTPVWRLRMDFSAYRTLIETPLSITREVTANGANVGADLRISERLLATGLIDRRRYADGNYRNLWSAHLTWRALRSPVALFLVPGYRGFAFSRWEDNGYYSPEEYHNLGCGIRIRASVKRALAFVLEGRVSEEKEGGGDFFTVGSFRTEIEFRATERISLGGEFFTSNSRLAGEAGYDRTLGGVFVGVRL